MTVYVITYDHKHGQDISVAATEADAQRVVLMIMTQRVDDDWAPEDRRLYRRLRNFTSKVQLFDTIEAARSDGERLEIVPLLERVNFLAIFASNLDEFFMVRDAGLKRRIVTGLAVPTNTGRGPSDVLADINRMALELQHRHAAVFQQLVKPELDDAGIHVESWADLNDDDRTRVAASPSFSCRSGCMQRQHGFCCGGCTQRQRRPNVWVQWDSGSTRR